MTNHYWDNDLYIDSRINEPFEVDGWIYILTNKLVDEEYNCHLSKIGFSKNPLAAVRRWRRTAEKEYAWAIHGVFGKVDSCSDHRIHQHLMNYGIERVTDQRLGREWFYIPGESAAAIVRFYLASKKKYPLRVWVPKEIRETYASKL